MNLPVIHIITPCFNPGGKWDARYRQIIEQVSQWDFAQAKFIIVDDGSTQAISRPSPSVEMIRYEDNRGKGYAIRYGLVELEASYVIYTDIDFPYQYENLERMARSIVKDKSDVIMGKRSPGYFKHIPIQRTIISKVLIFLNRYILRLKYPDTQCGLKAINSKAIDIFKTTKQNGFLFEIEFVKKAQKSLQINTLPVKLHTQTTLKNVSLQTLIKQLKDYKKLLKR